jgi:hypothetical protein
MPVPTSSLVFALAAAVPFGLAIKDTVAGTYDRPFAFAAEPDGDEEDALEHYGTEQAIREQALDEFRLRHSAIAEAERVRRLDDEMAAARAVPHESFDGLFGAEVASIGPRFENLVLGGAQGAKDLSALWPDHDVMLLGDGATTHTLYIKVNADERVCDALSDQLAETWGRPTGGQWLNPAIGQRARIDTISGCVLQFEKTVPVDDWLAKSTTAVVPMAAIGRSAKQLIATLGARANVSDNGRIAWTAPGLGIGAGITTITAYIKADRVVGLFASVNAHADQQDAVIARITTLVGKDPGEGDKLIWRTSPVISVETGTQLFLRIGEQPERN